MAEKIRKRRVPPVRYVILFPGRTGSTYLVGHMISHPEIAARYEILSRHRDSWDDQVNCLDKLYGKRRFPVIGAVGFKCKLSQLLDRKAFKNYLQENSIKVVHQVRRNKLKYIVSVVRARMLRSEQGRSNILFKEQYPIGPIEIPVPVFTRASRRLNVVGRLERFVERLELPKMTTAYEDLISNEKKELKRIWDFLDVSNRPTVCDTRKNTPDDIRQAVTNLDEILEHHPEMSRFVDD